MPEPSPASATPGAHGVRLFEPAPALPPAIEALWCALDARDLLAVDGDEAVAFLQGQLTQDIARLAEDRVLFAAHCTPKGRITALFRAWRADGTILLDLPAGMGAAAGKRLSMYVLRAKARVTQAATAWERTGVAGSALVAALEAAGLPVPMEPGRLLRTGRRACLCLGDARWLVVNPAGEDGGLRARLAALAAEQPTHWQLAALRAGEPEVLPAAVEAFVPQMLNLDALDGISFRKGCYTGQEIVARAHFLGRVKRRMRRFGYSGAQPPLPGSVLEVAGAAPVDGSDGDESGARAQVVWAVATHDGGGEALAVATVPPGADSATTA